VKPDEGVLFKGGHLGEASGYKGNCGCPAPPPIPTQVARTAPPPPPPLAQAKPAEPLATPPSPSPEQHVAIEAPFVFRGDDPTPDLTENVAVLRLENNKVVQLEPTVLPPANAKKKSSSANNTQTAKKESHGFFGKIGAFFAAIFH